MRNLNSHELKARCGALVTELGFRIVRIGENDDEPNAWLMVFEFDLPPFSHEETRLLLALEKPTGQSILRLSAQFDLAEQHRHAVNEHGVEGETAKRLTVDLTRECALYRTQFFWVLDDDNFDSLRTERLIHADALRTPQDMLDLVQGVAWASMAVMRFLDQALQD